MAGTNGKQHHLTASEIIAKAREKRMVAWRWDGLDLDTLVRPRTTAENAAAVDEETRYQEDLERYEDAPEDRPTSLDHFRIVLRNTVPCILDAVTRAAIFDHEDIDALLELDTPTLQAAIDKVNAVSNFTPAMAEEAEKNSAATDDASTSSVSLSDPATSTSSATPASSTTT